LNILITGANRGIGKELLTHYLEQRENVRGLSKKECDLASWEETSLYFNNAVSGDLDLVIHCAAVNITKFFYKMDYQAFKDMVEGNILGTFNLLKCSVPKLKANGSIVVFSSVAAFSPRMGQSAYACCKSALHGLVKVLSQELIAEQKYIFLIAPGIVETGMPMDMMSDIALKKAIDLIPMKRFCQLEEIINTIEFVRVTPYLTGQTIHLNGAYCIL
jgi:NAD(P)-dependent dehydrogenase (short-subunit alcohol dehydrogenase family)